MSTLPSSFEPSPSIRRKRWWQWRNRTRVIVTLIVTMIVWGLTDVRSRGRVDPANLGAHRTDFTVYTEAGAAFFDGREPYSVTNPRGFGYLYPPLFAMLMAPMHAINPQAQVVTWFAISVLLAWGCYRESVRIARAVLPVQMNRGSFGPLPQWIGWCAVAAATLPALNCLQRGQVGILKLYLLLLGFRVLVGKPSTFRAFAAGAILATPIVLKVTPAITVGCVLLGLIVADLRDRRRLAVVSPTTSSMAGTVIGLVVCLFLVPALLVGWRSNLQHLETWSTSIAKNAERSTEGDLAGDSYSIRNQSLTNAVCRFGNWAHHRFFGGPLDKGGRPDAEGKRGLIMESPQVEAVLRAICLFEGCLLLLAVCRASSSSDPRNLAAIFGAACVSTLVIAPIARGHYYVLMLPAVMFVVPWMLGHGRHRLAIAMAFTPPALVVAHYLFMGIAGRVGLLGIGTAAWFTMTTIAMIRLGPLTCVRSDGSRVDSSSHLPAPHAAWRSTITAPTLAPRSTR